MFLETLARLRCPVCSPKQPLALTLIEQDEATGEVLHGVLECGGCRRWFRVEDGIPDLVRDELREVEDEERFLKRHSGSLERTYQVPATSPNEADLRIIDEGRHWGRFMRRFWDVGDRSIFDIRIRGTHPSFYVAGVLEPDDRDLYTRWANFPTANGDAAFLGLKNLSGRWGVDIGCGGGQFGLEAANQGVRMIGFDPSFEEAWLGRRHARDVAKGSDSATLHPFIDYVRAEPANPPFADAAFDLLMAKDSLHHVPELEEVFPRLLRMATQDALFVCHEHVAQARLKNRIIGYLMPRAVEKVRSRYPKVEIPPELLRDSANEDVSADAVRTVCERHFTMLHQVETLMLANDLELMAHYAFGKRRWVSQPVKWMGMVLEKVLLLLGDRQHLTFVGRRKGPC